MYVRKEFKNIMDVRNVITGVLFAVLAGTMSLTACQSQKKIKNLQNSVEVCRQNSIESYAKYKLEVNRCQRRLDLCKEINVKLGEKIDDYEDKLCD